MLVFILVFVGFFIIKATADIFEDTRTMGEVLQQRKERQEALNKGAADVQK